MEHEQFSSTRDMRQGHEPEPQGFHRRIPASAQWHHRYEKVSATGRRLIRISSLGVYAILALEILFALQGLLSEGTVAFVGWAATGILVSSIFLYGIAKTWMRAPRHKATKAEFALVENPEEAVWVVEVAIRSDFETIGQDRGVLGFQNGALFFNGGCCSFQIGSQDLWQESESYAVSHGRFGKTTRELFLTARHDSRSISFELLDHPEWEVTEQTRAFDKRVREFTEGAPTSEPRSLPPSHAPSKELSAWQA